MGHCRGSGVLRLYPEGWKIEHYNLAVTVPNEKMDRYLKKIVRKK
ncbi:MAG: nuclear transport factor 2 family protein [Saprospirales bacterium]|nr:nuclear transport factor 2 family protein [Saprospirales bacterium]